MDVTIQVKPSNNLTTKEALFISFPYDLEAVNKIKSLPKRYYIPSTKEWEVPVAKLNDIISLFQEHEIVLKGKATTRITKEVASVVRFDKVTGEDFQFKTSPFDHQVEGFRYGLENNKFLLGDEQGLGKTKQVIDIAVARKSQFKHCLIVCGVNSLKWNWLKEVAIHSNETAHILGSKFNKKGKMKDGSMKDRLADLNRPDLKNYFFLITNIESLRDKEIAKKLEEMCKTGTIGMVAIDEIHKAKNSTSQ